jgi:dihydrodipicolinate synthase/N-acetylneuraminate lyase
MSAVLLPLTTQGVDWNAFDAHLARTIDAGLVPAVNMDTGYVHLLDDGTRREVLTRTEAVSPLFVASALDERDAVDIADRGGTPIVFPSAATRDDVLDVYGRVARAVDAFYGFELSPVFHPDGCIWDLDTFRAVLDIPQCIGAKHSSLRRQPEWDRLAIRDELRPDFRVLTGNDLAIDMVMWGSDYLLGLSTFAPDLFATRDALWAKGDPAFHELNDALQTLGAIAFRPPVPAYRHSAAMFLKLRGWLDDDDVVPDQPRRPDSDRELLRTILERLESLA